MKLSVAVSTPSRNNSHTMLQNKVSMLPLLWLLLTHGILCTAFVLPCAPLRSTTQRESLLLQVTSTSNFGDGAPPTSSASTDAVDNHADEPPEDSSQQQQQQQQQQQLQEQTKPNNKRTLYQVLGAEPTATRDELKQNYVQLAKQSHPDALRNNNNDNDNNDNNNNNNHTDLDFSEIAAAWRILSDDMQRKRYDRSLQAERLSVDIAAWATEAAKPAADLSVQVLERVAIPFFRRTTATTLASLQAAAQKLAETKKRQEQQEHNSKTSNNNNNSNHQSLGQTVQAAMAAARRAGRAVDKMEMMEKSQELEQRALEQYKQAVETQNELKDVVDQRLLLSLHTHRSGLTTNEAFLILEDFNRTVADSLTVLQRAMLRHTVEEEIRELQHAEDAFCRVQQVDSQAQEEYREIVRTRLVASDALEQAEQEEEAARIALQQAQQRVWERRSAMDTASREFVQIEARANKSSYDVERLSAVVENQSEKVRQALKHKEREVLRAQGLDVSMATPDVVSAEEVEERTKQMDMLRKQEQILKDKCDKIEVKAARLISRSNQIKASVENMAEA